MSDKYPVFVDGKFWGETIACESVQIPMWDKPDVVCKRVEFVYEGQKLIMFIGKSEDK